MFTERTVLAESVRCHHNCPVCGEDKPHQATFLRPCVFLKSRICDDCVRVQIALVKVELSKEKTS